MEELLGSKTKTMILLYLGLRGGTTGRRLSRILKINPTQIFKALRQLTTAGIVIQTHPSGFYALNVHYPFYEELLSMIHKQAAIMRKALRLFMPNIPEERRVDPLAVYDFIALRGAQKTTQKFSDILRKRYA